MRQYPLDLHGWLGHSRERKAAGCGSRLFLCSMKWPEGLWLGPWSPLRTELLKRSRSAKPETKQTVMICASGVFKDHHRE